MSLPPPRPQHFTAGAQAGSSLQSSPKHSFISRSHLKSCFRLCSGPAGSRILFQTGLMSAEPDHGASVTPFRLPGPETVASSGRASGPEGALGAAKSKTSPARARGRFSQLLM